jgi:ABC-type glycerol-3-phosphate transport system substrate-binding protein
MGKEKRMKKFLAIIFSLVLAVGLFAAPVTITVLSSGYGAWPDGTDGWKVATAMLHKDFPDVKVDLLQMNLASGSSLSMDAMLAAGTPPNIMFDNMVRASKYMVPEFALDLNKYIRDIGYYDKNILAEYTRNGALLGLPIPAHTQGMCINTDIMKEIGYTVKWDWTTDDYLKMCDLVKQKYKGKKFGTMLFAANQSGDYLLHNWFEAFGAHYYLNQDYDNATIAKTGGAKTYEFYQTLVKNGYVPPNASTLNDDDYCLEWSKGNIAAIGFFDPWTYTYIKSAVDQKLIDKPFNYAFVPFPRGPGVAKVPGYSMTGAYVVYKSKNEELNKLSARLVEYLNGSYYQSFTSFWSGTIPNRSDATPPIGNINVEATMRIARENGIYDCGITDPRFTERRALQYPILQKVLNLSITPEAAIKEYEAKLTAVKR